MKTRIAALLLVLFAFSIAGCKEDDDDDTGGTSSIAKLASTVYYENGVIEDTETYEFNSSGQITKLSYDDGYYFTITYSGSTIVIKEYDDTNTLLTTIATYTLNSKGLATSMTSDAKKGKASGFMKKMMKLDPASSSAQYTYDANNYLIREVYIYDGSSDTTTYTISGGNTITQSISGYQWNYQFLTDKTNTIGNENMGVSFLGKQNKNLTASETVDFGGGPNTTSFSYEYDSQGRVTKMWETGTTGDYVLYTYK